MKFETFNKIGGIILIILSFTVAIPLTLKTIETSGGTWGFGMNGLSILLPLSTYFLFGVTGLMNRVEKTQRKIFIASHLISIATGIVSFIIFPLLPWLIMIAPVVLAVVGIANKKNLKYYVLLMILLPIVANVLLLKWEFDFDRTFPLFQLFESSVN